MNPELTLTLAELQAKAKLCAQLSLGVVPDIADIEAVRSLQDELDDTVRSAVQRGLVPADPEAAVLEWCRELVAWADHVLSFVADNQRVADEIQSVADRLHTRGSAPGTHLPTQVSQRQIEDWAADLSAARTTARARLDSFRGQIIDSHWHGDSPSPGLMFVAQAAATRSSGSPAAVAEQAERCVRARRVVCGHEPREAGHPERTELDAALDQAHAAIEALKAGQLTHGRQLQAVDEKARAGDVEAAIRDLERLPRLFADCDYDGAAAVLNALREVEVLCTAESVGGVPSGALDLGELRCRVTAATAHWPADVRAALIQRLDRAGATIQARSERHKAWRAIRDLTVTIAAGVWAALAVAVLFLSALPKHPMANTNTIRSAVAEPPTVNTNAIDMLSPEQAKTLATGEDWLPLNGLTMLSDEAAKALAQHKGGLSLTGLTTLSDGAAKALAQHRGMLYLDGLTTLSDEAAKALRANPGVVMPNKFRR